MPLPNYTTRVSVDKTVGAIQTCPPQYPGTGTHRRLEKRRIFIGMPDLHRRPGLQPS
jgi:hypothetical protein